jgi:hypothetical protein
MIVANYDLFPTNFEVLPLELFDTPYNIDNYQQICEQQIVWTGCKRPVERPFIIALRGTNVFGLYHIVCKPVLVMNVAKELIMRS